MLHFLVEASEILLDFYLLDLDKVIVLFAL